MIQFIIGVGLGVAVGFLEALLLVKWLLRLGGH